MIHTPEEINCRPRWKIQNCSLKLDYEWGSYNLWNMSYIGRSNTLLENPISQDFVSRWGEASWWGELFVWFLELSDTTFEPWWPFKPKNSGLTWLRMYYGSRFPIKSFHHCSPCWYPTFTCFLDSLFSIFYDMTMTTLWFITANYPRWEIFCLEPCFVESAWNHAKLRQIAKDQFLEFIKTPFRRQPIWPHNPRSAHLARPPIANPAMTSAIHQLGPLASKCLQPHLVRRNSEKEKSEKGKKREFRRETESNLKGDTNQRKREGSGAEGLESMSTPPFGTHLRHDGRRSLYIPGTSPLVRAYMFWSPNCKICWKVKISRALVD